MSIITLTTDIGIEDEYAGVMKGVIFSVYPDATIVDITHHIQPQDVIQAAFTIKASYKYFPSGTVHIVVVDPGVGSERPILALEKLGHFFLAPDNGALSLLFDDTGMGSIVHVKNTRYFLDTVSQTFHGRDIFAPVGAHMALGVNLTDLGDLIEKNKVVRLNINKPVQTKDEISGHVISIDRFGNLISNIDEECLTKIYQKDRYNSIEFSIGQRKITGLSHSYENSKNQEPLAIIGSRGTLEIAVNKGSAQKYFMAGKGDIIKVLI
ncbi:MAG: SAM-dependent chlorinase/fluorinase [Desulfobacterales bacterium]|nr:SAM-dependent chlorinase/fluorinase [Desulfobacterales bacterium]